MRIFPFFVSLSLSALILSHRAENFFSSVLCSPYTSEEKKTVKLKFSFFPYTNTLSIRHNLQDKNFKTQHVSVFNFIFVMLLPSSIMKNIVFRADRYNIFKVRKTFRQLIRVKRNSWRRRACVSLKKRNVTHLLFTLEIWKTDRYRAVDVVILTSSWKKGLVLFICITFSDGGEVAACDLL